MTREEAIIKLNTTLSKIHRASVHEDHYDLSKYCPEILEVYKDYMNPTKRMNVSEFMEKATDEIVKYNSPLAKALR